MPRKPKPEPEASTVTVQLGLDTALGEGTVEKPELQLIALDQLTGIPDKHDPKWDDESWVAFVESCRTGLEEAIKVRPNADGTFEVRDGRHRALAYRTLRMKEIPATVRSDWSDDKKAALAEFKLNALHAAPTPYEQALTFQRAQTAGLDVKEIAKQRGISEATVRSRLQLVAPGFPEHVARRVGVDLDGEAAGIFTALLDHPELLAIASKVKIGKNPQTWMLQRDVQAALVASGKVANVSLSYEDKNRIGGYENKTWDKRVKALPTVQVGNATFTTDAAAFKAAYDDELAKAQARVAELRGKGAKGKNGKKETAADVEGLLTRRAQARAVALQRELAAKRISSMVSWNDDKELRMAAVVLDYRVAKKADWDFLVAATGMELEPLQAIVERTYNHDGDDAWEKAVKKLWKDDRLQLHKILAAVLCLRDMGYNGYFSHDDKGDDCAAWTGKDGKEIYGTAKAEVRAAMKEATAKRTEKEAKAKANGKKAAAAGKRVKATKAKKGKPLKQAVADAIADGDPDLLPPVDAGDTPPGDEDQDDDGQE